MPRASRKRPAEYDDLARLVHTAIDGLEISGRLDDGGADSRYADYNGYCARACAAYLYLAEHDPAARALSRTPGLRLKRLKKPGAAYGESHYWLESPDGQVLDLIFQTRKRLARGIPYADGKGASVRRDRTDPALPAAKDTQAIIAVVRTML